MPISPTPLQHVEEYNLSPLHVVPNQKVVALPQKRITVPRTYLTIPDFTPPLQTNSHPYNQLEEPTSPEKKQRASAPELRFRLSPRQKLTRLLPHSLLPKDSRTHNPHIPSIPGQLQEPSPPTPPRSREFRLEEEPSLPIRYRSISASQLSLAKFTVDGGASAASSQPRRPLTGTFDSKSMTPLYPSAPPALPSRLASNPINPAGSSYTATLVTEQSTPDGSIRGLNELTPDPAPLPKPGSRDAIRLELQLWGRDIAAVIKKLFPQQESTRFTQEQLKTFHDTYFATGKKEIKIDFERAFQQPIGAAFEKCLQTSHSDENSNFLKESTRFLNLSPQDQIAQWETFKSVCEGLNIDDLKTQIVASQEPNIPLIKQAIDKIILLLQIEWVAFKREHTSGDSSLGGR
jgi:hypothetical protein